MVLSTATTITIEGGVNALDTDEEKAKFAKGIEEAMATSWPTVEVKVLSVTATAAGTRRLAEPGSNYDGIVPPWKEAGFGFSEKASDAFTGSWSETAELSSRNDVDATSPPDSKHRALTNTISSVTVAYEIVIPDDWNHIQSTQVGLQGSNQVLTH